MNKEADASKTGPTPLGYVYVTEGNIRLISWQHLLPTVLNGTGPKRDPVLCRAAAVSWGVPGACRAVPLHHQPPPELQLSMAGGLQTRLVRQHRDDCGSQTCCIQIYPREALTGAG